MLMLGVEEDVECFGTRTGVTCNVVVPVIERCPKVYVLQVHFGFDDRPSTCGSHRLPKVKSKIIVLGLSRQSPPFVDLSFHFHFNK